MLQYLKVNEYQIALVFKGEVYKNILETGNYWLWNKHAITFTKKGKFIPPIEMQYLLVDEKLKAQLHVIEVADQEIVIVFEDGRFKEVLTAGNHLYWKSFVNYSFQRYSIKELEVGTSVDRGLLNKPELSEYIRMVEVNNYEQCVLMVNGVVERIIPAGTYYFWKNEQRIQLARADMRIQQLELNGQEILSSDKAGLRINAWAQYKIVDVLKAVIDTKETERQFHIALQLVLREYVAGFSFDQLLEKKESIAAFVMEKAQTAANSLGLELLGFGIRDIILPGDIKEIMNQVLVAEKKAQANIITRREETASTRNLLNTAKLMEENPMLWKLKEMEYMERITDKVQSISLSSGGNVIGQLQQLFGAK